MSTVPAQRSAPPHTPGSPPALRTRRSPWRDPRLATGLALIAVSVVVGARFVGSSEDMADVLAARDTIVAGQRIGPDDVMSVRIRFSDAEAVRRYLPGTQDLPVGTVLTRTVGAGELVPRAAVGASGGDAALHLPLSVAGSRVPRDVGAGDRVDVWVTPQDAVGQRETSPAALVLAGVEVIANRGDGTGQRQVVVAVAPEVQSRLPQVVAQLDTGSVLLLRR